MDTHNYQKYLWQSHFDGTVEQIPGTVDNWWCKYNEETLQQTPEFSRILQQLSVLNQLSQLPMPHPHLIWLRTVQKQVIGRRAAVTHSQLSQSIRPLLEEFS